VKPAIFLEPSRPRQRARCGLRFGDARGDPQDKWSWLTAVQPGRESRPTHPRVRLGRHRRETGHLAGSTIQEQTGQALAICEAILHEAGATLDDVVEVGVLLTNPADFAGMNEEYATWFPADPPCRYVAKLGVEVPGVLVSIPVSAFVG
jgi:2-iminobutanoate/2-iminopropanoate deaminase